MIRCHFILPCLLIAGVFAGAHGKLFAPPTVHAAEELPAESAPLPAGPDMGKAVSRLGSLFKEGDDAARARAAAALVKIGKPSVDFLTDLLREESTPLALGNAAAEALGEIGDPSAAAALSFWALKTPSTYHESAAARVLVRMGPASVKPLLPYYYHNVSARGAAALMLDLMDQVHVIDACRTMMQESGEESSFRMMAGDYVYNLLHEGPIIEELIEFYSQMIKEPSASADERARALDILEELTGEEKRELWKRTVEYRYRNGAEQSAAALSYYSLAASIPHMVACLVEPMHILKSDIVRFLDRIEILQAEGRFLTGLTALALEKVARSEEPLHRKVAAQYLIYSDSETRDGALKALAEDEVESVREAARASLAGIAPPSREPLARSDGVSDASLVPDLDDAQLKKHLLRLNGEENETQVNIMIDELAGGGAAMVERLMGMLNGDDYEVRSGAARALGGCGGPEAVEALIETATYEPEPGKVEKTAYQSSYNKLVGYSLAPRPTTILVTDTKEKKKMEEFRLRSIEALGRLGYEDSFPAVADLFHDDQHINFLKVVTRAMVLINSEEAVPLLTKEVTHGKSHTRSAAVEALGLSPYHLMRDFIIDVLEKKDVEQTGYCLTIIRDMVRHDKIDKDEFDDTLFDVLANLPSGDDLCTRIEASATLVDLGWTESFVADREQENIEAMASHYLLHLMLGAPDSEPLLASVLDSEGNTVMYRAYQSCTNSRLAILANDWAAENLTKTELSATERLPCTVNWGTSIVTRRMH